MNIPNDNLDRFGLIAIIIIVVIGLLLLFIGNLEATLTIPKDKPVWINLTANQSHLFFSYDAEKVPGFKSVLFKTSWEDPEMNSNRELYQLETGLIKDNISFPKLVTVSTPDLFVGVTVNTEIKPGVKMSRQYIWRVSQEPFSLGRDKPTIDYIR
jgi:hypothetical protein